MSKLIIWVPGRPLINGPRRGKFEWSEKHQCYIFEGAEIEASDFNAKYPVAMKAAHESRPQVRVVEVIDVAVSVAIEAPATIATLSVAREITLEEAEEVVQRLVGRPQRPDWVLVDNAIATLETTRPAPIESEDGSQAERGRGRRCMTHVPSNRPSAQ